MDIDALIYKPSIIDKILLFRREILCSYRLGKNGVIFVCGGKHRCVYVKYSYPGNVQYHKIDFDDLDDHIQLLTGAKRIIQNMEADHV